MRRNAVSARKARRWSFALSLLRCGGLLVGTAAGVILYYALLSFRTRCAGRVPHLWHRYCRRIFGLDIAVHGAPAMEGAVLFACNHASYLDVTVIGSFVPAQFVAKAEVAQWPVIGRMCRLQNTLFTCRHKSRLSSELTGLRHCLERGAKVVFFPEGTSGNGNRVLPFKSSMFDVAETQFAGTSVRVQPVTIAYTRLDGLPLGRHLRPYFAWYGDMTLVGHVWRALGMGNLGVDVIFHEPVGLAAFQSRKRLAEYCRRRVEAGLASALCGRLPPPAAAVNTRRQPGFPMILDASWDLT